MPRMTKRIKQFIQAEAGAPPVMGVPESVLSEEEAEAVAVVQQTTQTGGCLTGSHLFVFTGAIRDSRHVFECTACGKQNWRKVNAE